MVKGKKKKTVEVLSLAEFCDRQGGHNIPIYKEITDGNTTKTINLADVPSAPKASYEVVIAPNIIRCGPPYHLVAKNVPFDYSIEQIREFFQSPSCNIEIQLDENQRHRGSAIIAFNTLEEYKAALEKDGMKLGTRSIILTQGKTTTEFDDKFDFNRRKQQRSRPDPNEEQLPIRRSDFYTDDQTIQSKSASTMFGTPSVADLDSNWRSKDQSTPSTPFSFGYNRKNNDRDREQVPNSENTTSRYRERMNISSNDSYSNLDFSILRDASKRQDVTPTPTKNIAPLTSWRNEGVN